MNQKKKIKLIATIAILIIILIMITCACINNLKKNKLKKNDINALSNGDITTIDITGITPAPESEHEHIYKTHYDDTKHWEECTVCGTKRNEIAHNFTTTWAAGKESCEKNNSYKKTCNCGYSKIGHKPCVWNGSSYLCPTYYHARKCSICEGMIQHTYYLKAYGSGNIYSATYQTTNKNIDYCRASNGTILDCNHAGTCATCKMNWIAKRHELYYDLNTGELYCHICNKKYGTCFQKIERNNENPGTYTITHTVNLTNGAVWYQRGTMRQAGSPWETNSQTVNKTSDTQFTVITVGKFKSTVKEGYKCYASFNVKIDGNIVVVLPKEEDYFIAMPDIKPPEVSNISVGSSDNWNRSKTIQISGVENYCNIVSVEIKNDRGRVVYSGDSTVLNNNWSISCTPEIEAGEESRTFTVTVTDACENSTTKNFEVSKVDGRPPTVTSSDKVTDSEWAREKTFTFTAEDLGIGNVEIGFNDVSDYSLAVKDGTNYSKEYKLVGDAYSPVQASVYFKDGLGNITTQVVTLEKIDNTAPTITNASLNNNVVSLTSHDRHSMLGEGSGVVKYRYITSERKLEKPQITENNSQEVDKNTELKIQNISQIKYIYVVAEDLVGNVGESYEIEVPQLVLRSEVNQEGADGKGTILLDWSGYDITNKYFVIYRKQEDEEKWKTIIGIDEKLNSNTYTDPLGNDKEKPNTPEITIEKDLQAGQIKINQAATDNGTTYTYYIEAYDKNTNELISRSNIS